MSRRFLSVFCLALLAFGCGRPAAPVLQPGDVVRPEVAFAPETPWPAGTKATIGVLVRVERPGGEIRYLNDEDVAVERAVLGGRVVFLNGERPLGDPREITLVHDC